VGLLESVILLVTVVLLVNDLVTVDVAAPEVEIGTGAGTDLVDTDPLLTELYLVAMFLLVTVVLLVTVLLPVDVETVGLPDTAVLLVVGLGMMYVLEPDVTAEVLEDCIDKVLYTVVVLVPGANVVVVKVIFVETASSLPVHVIRPVTMAQE
jgi:hypothetical protein